MIVERIPEEIVIRNQYVFVGGLGFLALAGGLLYYFRMKIWNELHVKIQNALANFYHRIFWSGVIRLMLELFYPTVLFAFVSLTTKDASKLYPAMIVTFYVGFCFATLLHLQHSSPEVDTADYKRNYGAYFTNVETNKKPGALHYSTLFLFRRLFCAVIITVLDIVVF